MKANPASRFYPETPPPDPGVVMKVKGRVDTVQKRLL